MSGGCGQTKAMRQQSPRAADGVLLTSEPVETYKQAMKIIHIYSQRWRVEGYHKAWKIVLGAERQRMAELENLEHMVSILALVVVKLV